jgi:hypothetical protein
VCLRNSVKNSGTLYYVEEDKETGLGGESDENPHSRKTRIFWPPENVSTPGWRRKIAKGLRAGDLMAYRVNTRNGIRALNVSQRSNLAMTPGKRQSPIPSREGDSARGENKGVERAERETGVSSRGNDSQVFEAVDRLGRPENAGVIDSAGVRGL